MEKLESLTKYIRTFMDSEFRPKATELTASAVGLLTPVLIAIAAMQDENFFPDRLIAGASITALLALSVFYIFGAENLKFEGFWLKWVSDDLIHPFIRLVCWLLSATVSGAVVMAITGNI